MKLTILALALASLPPLSATLAGTLGPVMSRTPSSYAAGSNLYGTELARHDAKPGPATSLCAENAAYLGTQDAPVPQLILARRDVQPHAQPEVRFCN